jgi:SPOR domain
MRLKLGIRGWALGIGHWVLANSITVITIACCLLSIDSFAQRKEKEPKQHREDLTDLRLKFPEVKDSILQKEDTPKFVLLPPEHAVHTKVNEVLDSIYRFNKTKLFVDGFTIQIYSGLKKEDAMNAKKKMVEEAEDLAADINYQQPKWRVKSGSYFTRLEAQRDLHRIKRIFPGAILVPEKVTLR